VDELTKQVERALQLAESLAAEPRVVTSETALAHLEKCHRKMYPENFDEVQGEAPRDPRREPSEPPKGAA
jgi:hypothetical protein